MSTATASRLAPPHRLLMLAGFSIMCGVWILTILLSGMKRYKAITALFGIAYVLIVATSLLMRPWGLAGLLGGFVLGNLVLLMGMWLLIVREFNPEGSLIAFDTNLRPRLWEGAEAMRAGVMLGASVADIVRMTMPDAQKLEGAISGRALYDGRIDPAMALAILRGWSDRLAHGDWLLGERASLADWSLLPFVRQFAKVDEAWFAQAPLPALRQWLHQHLSDPLFESVMQKPESPHP